MPIPTQALILLSGIPATGKSAFARHVAQAPHNFAHYDLECYPTGWPHPELKAVWDSNRSDFVKELRQRNDRIVLDWGFPVSCISWVKELRDNGVRLIWFDGDIVRARQKFISRGRGTVAEFNRQVESIQNEGYPGGLNCRVIRTLSSDNKFSELSTIVSMVFA